jgi:antitoxin HicB
MAADALATAMEFYLEDHRRVPAPSAAKRGEIAIGLPPNVAEKVLLLNEMLS